MLVLLVTYENGVVTDHQLREVEDAQEELEHLNEFFAALRANPFFGSQIRRHGIEYAAWALDKPHRKWIA